ncbi:MAG: ankyrin repeat domain-containing protein [Gammaproteobacteria bacterium]|nr:ankyrin repeat domain-containing protein [Gammaproteobacteria bacterium]
MYQHLLKHTTCYLTAQHRMGVPPINRATLKLKHPLCYRHLSKHPTIQALMRHLNTLSLFQLVCYLHCQFDVLFYACTTNNPTLLSHVLQHADRTLFSAIQNAIVAASENGHADVLNVLLKDPRVDPSDPYAMAVCLASEHGHTNVLKVLLNDPRFDPGLMNNRAIIRASENGHLQVVRLLLSDLRVNPADIDNLAINVAAENGHAEVVSVLLEHPDVNPSRLWVQ